MRAPEAELGEAVDSSCYLLPLLDSRSDFKTLRHWPSSASYVVTHCWMLMVKLKEFCHLISPLFYHPWRKKELLQQFFLKHPQLNSIFVYDIEKATLFHDFGLMPGHVSCVPLRSWLPTIPIGTLHPDAPRSCHHSTGLGQLPGHPGSQWCDINHICT